MRTDTAFIIHSHNGVAELVEVKIDGWVWECVQTCLDLYWEWETRCGWVFRSKPTYDSPLRLFDTTTSPH
jgi:hypothetical protein